MQQVRGEFLELAAALDDLNVLGGRCLQLGIGPCAASHFLWQTLFSRVTSVDQIAPENFSSIGLGQEIVIGNTRDPRVFDFARGSYDFLFIDAGHTLEDVLRDHEAYAPMVRPGGVVAFHDALERPQFTEEELGVPRFLKKIPLPNLTFVGTEVGVAYYVKGHAP